jgi:hypothetical protein
LSLIEADLHPNPFDPFLQQCEVFLQPQLLILDDADQLDELVILLFLFADVLLPILPPPYTLKLICYSFSLRMSRMKAILSFRMVDSVPYWMELMTALMSV